MQQGEELLVKDEGGYQKEQPIWSL